MPNPKRQHWLPQLCLRGFRVEGQGTGKNAQVWAFTRRDQDPILVSVKKIAVETYLYSPIDKNGDRDFGVERRLAELETTLGVIWPQVAEGFVSLENSAVRKILALFVATLYLRNPQILERQRVLHKRLVAEFDQLPKDEQGRPAIDEAIFRGERREMDTSGWQDYVGWGENEYRRISVRRS